MPFVNRAAFYVLKYKQSLFSKTQINKMFPNRSEAGQKLAQKLKEVLGEQKAVNKLLILAIPRGGVVIGRQIADFLKCPMDVIITKKIGAPGNPELAIGAVGTVGEPVIDEALAERVGADENYLKNKIEKIKENIEVQEKEFRQDKLPLDLKDKVVVITDDGVATGSTIKAAIEVVCQSNPQKIIVAIPVIARDALKEIENLADEVIYLEAPELFFAVGQFYQEFEQVSDETVKKLLSN
jgi:predicted phosphoribosyltransferase